MIYLTLHYWRGRIHRPNWTRGSRVPDFTVAGRNGVYLRRWWLLPKNPWFNVYLHQVLEDDIGRHPHDHRAHNISVILRGAYQEHLYLCHRLREVKYRSPGHIVWRPATLPHRLEVARGPVWSLFVKFPDHRNWGFWTENGWVPWDIYTDTH